ncbi:MAG: hypothetical protein WCJ30_26035 [Deltaproteobacteria bacterium]
MKQRRWEQSQLARHLEINVATLRRSLRRLQARDPSIASETDHPHVIWTVPRGWAPGALPLGAEGARALFHLLARTPGATRNELLGKVATLLPHAPAAGRMQQSVVVQALTEREETAFDVLCDATTFRQAVRMRYHSERSNEVETRSLLKQPLSLGLDF